MSTTKLEIKSFWGKLLFSHETEDNTIKKTVEAADLSGADLRSAVLRNADLSGADLRNADLSGADLSGAVLSGADLRNAVLSGAVLRSADLRNADLSGADLRNAVLSGAVLRSADLRNADLSGADLRNADLSGADLSGAVLSGADLRNAVLSGAVLRNADLSGADLSGAVLSGAVLRNADLSGADLSDIRNDFWDVLLRAQTEVEGLKKALIEGRVNGSTYEGECACLVGTIANIRHVDFQELGTIKPNASRPIERFFLGINKGDTPETNQLSKIVLEWIEEFQTLIGQHEPV